MGDRKVFTAWARLGGAVAATPLPALVGRSALPLQARWPSEGELHRGLQLPLTVRRRDP